MLNGGKTENEMNLRADQAHVAFWFKLGMKYVERNPDNERFITLLGLFYATND